MAEHIVTYYADPNEPLALEWSPDGIFWERISRYDEQPIEGCPAALVKQATVDVESGWVRARYLMGNPQLFDSTSNNVAVPEPAWIGLWSGILMLILVLRRRGRAC